jgi:hypothetical protein
VNIIVQPTPNPNAFKFTLDRQLSAGKSQTISSAPDPAADPLGSRLFAIPGVTMVFLLNDFITISKSADANWENLVPQIEAALHEHFS